MIAQIKSDLSQNRQTLRPFYEMNYVLVPDNQPRLAINFFNYSDESDLDGGVDPTAVIPSLPICRSKPGRARPAACHFKIGSAM